MYFIAILLLPFIDIALESIKKDSSKYYKGFDSSILLKLLTIIAIGLIVLQRGGDLVQAFFITLFLSVFVIRHNPRIIFFMAMFCFVYVGILLLLDNEKLSEKISIYAYYLLIIGVVAQIRDGYLDKKHNDGK